MDCLPQFDMKFLIEQFLFVNFQTFVSEGEAYAIAFRNIGGCTSAIVRKVIGEQHKSRYAKMKRE